MKKDKIKEILKTGNFTVYFHDNGSGTIYKGKFTKNEIEECPEKYERKVICEFGYFEEEGYCSLLDVLLVGALGGEIHSI